MARRLSKIEKMWGKDTLAAGFVAIPTLLLIYQSKLALTPTDVCIILNILSFSRGDNPVYPAKERITSRMSIDESTFRRHIALLEKKGYIKRVYQRKYNLKTSEWHQTPNIYNFDGLIKALKECVPLWKDSENVKKVKREYREFLRTIDDVSKLEELA